MVEYCCFPMAECVEVYLKKSRVVEFPREFSSLLSKPSSESIVVDVTEDLRASFGKACSIPKHFWLRGSILGLLFFSAVIRTVLCSKSRSLHVRFWSSPERAPVSFASWRNAEIFLPQPAIKASISCSVGIKGILCTGRYIGGCHDMFCIFRNRL